AYPLKVRSLPKPEIRHRVIEFLRLIELEPFANRHPGQLSGGQRQRVALARALIFEPTLVLMDEPLGALDKKLREQMQFEITRLHRRLGFTVIYVTHDQSEALTMSSRIAVFNAGKVQQFAPPDALYEQPANAFVAGFIGENNLVTAGRPVLEGSGMVATTLPDGTALCARNGDCQAASRRCAVSIRPEKLAIVQPGQAFDNQVAAAFMARHYVGDFMRYYFQLPGGGRAVVKLLNDARAPVLREGEFATLGWMARDSSAFQSDAPNPGDKT